MGRTTSTGSSKLDSILTEWYALLQGWAQDGSLVAAAEEALMLSGNKGTQQSSSTSTTGLENRSDKAQGSAAGKNQTTGRLQSFLAQFSAGNMQNIPKIVLLPGEDMGGALGAYDASTNTIYINETWLVDADKNDVISVLNEKLGHSLDATLNTTDTQGDEGDYFAKLVAKTTLSQSQRTELKSETDAASITVNGDLVSVEQSTGSPPVFIRANSLYTIIVEKAWDAAQTASANLGGSLAIISSASENQFIVDAFTTILNDIAFIGHNDLSKEGEWRYPDGTLASFFNWADGEPSNQGEEDVAATYLRSADYGVVGVWNDVPVNGYGNILYGIAEVPITSNIVFSGTAKEGQTLTTTINLNAGTTTNLVIGTKVYWSITGISLDDLASGTLEGEGVIGSNGQLQISHSLKDDGITETEQLKVSVYSDISRTPEFQIGTTQSVNIVDTGVPFRIGEFTSDDSTIYISGTSGLTSSSKIESVSFIKSTTGTGKNRVTTLTPNYTLLATYSNPGVDGITFNGGSAANTISAAGVAGDYSRPTFNGQTILNGELGTDSITGGSYRNWLVGGGIFSTPLSTATTAVDTLIGNVGAMDVFDLRTADFTSDAYSALNSGSARINNYTLGEDWIVLAGAQGSYSFTAVQTTTGSKRNKVTTTTGYHIFSGTELVATVNAASGSTVTGNAATDLQIHYGQTGDPTETLFNGQQLFF